MKLNKKLQLLFILSCFGFLAGCSGDSPPNGIGISSGGSGGGASGITGSQIITDEGHEGTTWETECLEDVGFDPDNERPDVDDGAFYSVKYRLRINNDVDRVTLTHRYWDQANTTCEGEPEASYEARYQLLAVTNVRTTSGAILYHRMNLEITPTTGWTAEKYLDFDTATIDSDEVMYIGDCYDLDDNAESGVLVGCSPDTSRPLYRSNANNF